MRKDIRGKGKRQYERNRAREDGKVPSASREPVATEAEIARFVNDPPENTRAWTRAMLLRAAGSDRVVNVDWDRIELKSADGYARRTHIQLSNPLGATRLEAEPVFSGAADFSSLLDGLHSAGVIIEAQNHYSTGSAVNLLDGNRYREFNQYTGGDSNE